MEKNDKPKRKITPKRPMKRVKLNPNQEAPVTGVGDILKKITNALGFETCDECEKRRQALNDMFSFLRRTKRELSQQEIDMLVDINKTNIVKDSGLVFRIYNEVFGVYAQPCTCPGLLKDIVFKLSKVMEKQLIK